MKEISNAAWFTSSRSNGNGECVEARNHADSGIDIRDSKIPHGPILSFGAEARLSFVTAIKGQAFGVCRRFPD